MAVVTMKSLLESGVHFGHQVKRCPPSLSGTAPCAPPGPEGWALPVTLGNSLALSPAPGSPQLAPGMTPEKVHTNLHALDSRLLLSPLR